MLQCDPVLHPTRAAHPRAVLCDVPRLFTPATTIRRCSVLDAGCWVFFPAPPCISLHVRCQNITPGPLGQPCRAEPSAAGQRDGTQLMRKHTAAQLRCCSSWARLRTPTPHARPVRVARARTRSRVLVPRGRSLRRGLRATPPQLSQAGRLSFRRALPSIPSLVPHTRCTLRTRGCRPRSPSW